MARIPRSIRSALALTPKRALARDEDAVAGPPAPRYRFYAALERGGELYTHPILARTIGEAEEIASIHCRGRGYRLDRIDPEWDAVEIAGRLILRAGLSGEVVGAPCADPAQLSTSSGHRQCGRLASDDAPARTIVGNRGSRMKDLKRQPKDQTAAAAQATETASEEASSPVCYASEMDAHYAGYLDRSELVALLNLLLESERAGAKLLNILASEAADEATAAILAGVRRDEARYVAMLSRAVRALGGEPSKATGAFLAKCLAIEGLGPRLAFLNRGQAWVARKITEALPRIRDDALHGRLQEMLATHEANIRRCEAFLASLPPAGN